MILVFLQCKLPDGFVHGPVGSRMVVADFDEGLLAGTYFLAGLFRGVVVPDDVLYWSQFPVENNPVL